jgi:ribonuclease J
VSDKKGNHRGGDAQVLDFIALGGMNEIGKNMFVFRYRDEILVVDGGLAFPDANMLGVDLIVPRIDYLIENAKLIKGWVLTHGHEDHIGGVPYFLPRLPKVPIYGARLTLGLLRAKLEEFQIGPGEVDLHEISTDHHLQIGRHFSVDLFRITHSIPDNSGLIIRTPVGTIVHSGDFKLDHHPPDGKTSELLKLSQAGAEGVLALISDSTNGERPGYTPSEADVKAGIDTIVAQSPGRVILTSFASHIGRIQNVIRVAEKYGRRVVIEGRSMIKNTEIAMELGYLEVKTPLIAIDDVGDLPPNKVLFLCTGSQGQPMSVLSRLASGTHRKLAVREGDTVILSASPIPGNEEAVGRVINAMYAAGARVFYPPAYRVHASGHGSHEELKLLFSLVRPRYFMPFHGEWRHQVNHIRLVESLPYPPQRSLIPRNGDLIRISADEIKVVGAAPAGNVYVDGLGVGDVSDVVLRDRQTMSSDGALIIVALAGRNPSVEVISRGFVESDSALLKEIESICLEALTKAVREKRKLSDIRDDVYYPVRRFIRKETGRSPVIIPSVIEV